MTEKRSLGVLGMSRRASSGKENHQMRIEGSPPDVRRTTKGGSMSNGSISNGKLDGFSQRRRTSWIGRDNDPAPFLRRIVFDLFQRRLATSSSITGKENLYPFTATRSVADIRIGILTIREKWERILNEKIYTTSEIDLKGKERNKIHVCSANLVPSAGSFEALLSGAKDTGSILVEYPWHIFQYNDKALREDFELICKDRTSQLLSPTNKAVSSENIFISSLVICLPFSLFQLLISLNAFSKMYG